MIKKGRLEKYTKDDKRSWEDSSKKNQAHEKIVEVMVSGKGKDMSSGEEEWHKEKHQHIASITGDAMRVRNPSKSTVKRKIIELMNVNKKDGNNSTKSLGRHILIF